MSVDRHAYYEQLKARGYYKNDCACGRKKSLQARMCRKCAGALATHQLQLETCACGRAKSRYARRCLTCVRGVATPPEFPINPNPYCPNPGLGGAECSAHYPHKHCACLDAIDLDKAMCWRCIRESARGAAMTAKESREFEVGGKLRVA